MTEKKTNSGALIYMAQTINLMGFKTIDEMDKFTEQGEVVFVEKLGITYLKMK